MKTITFWSQHWFRKRHGTEQVTSHYLNQCWSRSLISYGVIRPQYVRTGNSNCFSCRFICSFSWSSVPKLQLWVTYISELKVFYIWEANHENLRSKKQQFFTHWGPLPGLSLCPILKSSHCNSFEDWAPVNSIYGCPILKICCGGLIT